MGKSTIHAAMFPWPAMGHITPFLHLSNKLAEKGHKVSFLVPIKTKDKLHHLNHHPDLIHFIPITIPHVPGLPPGAESMSDISWQESPLLKKAFDQTQEQVKTALHQLQPDVIFFDFSYWLPNLVRPLRAKCILFTVVSAAAIATVLVPARKLELGQQFTEEELMEHPPGFPKASSLKVAPFEARGMLFMSGVFVDGISFYHRMTTAMRESDAICFRGCDELDGEFCDYIQNQYNKLVMLIGPTLPEPSDHHNTPPLEERWGDWLDGFDKGSVVYCAFGSECVLDKEQFQELVLGLELTGLPFIVRLKPPFGAETVEEALPEGFEGRVQGRGVVHGGWVQQRQILSHPSVGCFVSHCGFGSMWESLISNCQIVLVPHMGDQFLNAKFMTNEMKVAVNVERAPEDARFTRDGVCKAVKLVMDQGSEAGQQIRGNHQKWRELLSSESFASNYMSNFFVKLEQILN